ncbi:MAG: FHA domain-containing protein [Desulfobacteraceae bacterium]|nr:MAG: FHA domain-containing protein [Desulfobacteraceae bacterium]
MPRLYVSEGPLKGQTFDFKKKTVFIGRSSRNDIQINDKMISRKHLKIFKTGESFSIEDLRSTNGTLLNGELIAPGQGYELTEQDTIVIGNTVIQLDGISPAKALGTKDLGPPSPRPDPDELQHSTRERRSRSPKNLQLIYRASELLEQPLDINVKLEKLLDSLFDTLPRIDDVSIILFNEKEKKIKEVIARSRQDKAKKAIRYSKTLLDRVVQDGKAVKVSNTTCEAQSEDLERMNTLQIRSALCVPMIINTRVSGAIYVDSLRGPYDSSRKEDLLLLNSLSGFIAAAIEKSSLIPG